MSSLSEKKVPYFVRQSTELNVAKRHDSRLPSVQSKRSKKEERSISAKSNSAAASSDKRFRPSSDGFQWRRSSSLTNWSLPVPRPDTHSGHRLTVKNLIFHRKSTGSDRRVHFKHDLYSNSRTPSPCSTLEDFEVHRPRFQAISGPKRFSEGDVLEARHQQSLDAADQKSHLNKFRNVTKATIFSNRLEGRRISEIEEQLTMDVRGEGRRGTVHGSQLYVVSDGGRLSRRIDEPISKQRLSTLLSATLKAKEEEKKNMLRRLQTVSRVVGRVCALQKIVMQRNANDTVYQSQLKDIGSSPVNEKNT